MNNIEPFHQAYTYDTGNNLTTLSHQANSLVIIDIVLCSVTSVCFGELVKGVIVVPM
jgi:hypothetical protein